MNSLWNSSCQIPSFPTLRHDIKTDVLIIGGGAAGLLTAYLLGQKGVDCVLVEKGRICGGITQNTTAKITFQHGLLYHKLLKSGGVEVAKGYLQANQAAFAEYAALCREIDCDYEQKDNFVYTINNRQTLEDELEALQKLGYTASLCERLPLPFPTDGAVRFPAQAQFHPLKFFSAIAAGSEIY